MKHCPVCQEECKTGNPCREFEGAMNIFVGCKRCGDYCVTDSIYQVFGIPPECLDRCHQISAALRAKHDEGDCILLTYEKVERKGSFSVQELLENYSEPDVGQKLNNILQLLYERTDNTFGKHIAISRSDCSAVGTRDPIELESLLDELENSKLISKRRTIQGFYVTLTLSGYKSAEESSKTTKSNQLTDLQDLGRELHNEIICVNRISQGKQGQDLFKHTNETSEFFHPFPKEVKSEIELKSLCDKLFKVLYEGSGNLERVPNEFVQRFIEIKHLRRYWSHDLDHGDKSESQKKLVATGKIFEKHGGHSSPASFMPEDFKSMSLSVMKEVVKVVRDINRSLS